MSHKHFDRLFPEKHVPAQVAPVVNAGRVRSWLTEQAMPLWSERGVDWHRGGFHEVLDFDSAPLEQTKRMRTTARQVHAFSLAKALGCCTDADKVIDHGVTFMLKGRTGRGGWAGSVNPDGTLLDPTEGAYDQACVLLALVHAHQAGHPDARRLGEETVEFLDRHLEDPKLTGFLETPEGSTSRRATSQMRLLEAFLAWYEATGDRDYLRKAADLGKLFEAYFFDPKTWSAGEFFDDEWMPAPEKGGWAKPGHQLEWAALLVRFAAASGQRHILLRAWKLYSFALASGTNRKTGLAYGLVTKGGRPLDRASPAWPQTEAVKAVVALDGVNGQDLAAEASERLARLFRSHIDPAPQGLWIDHVDEWGVPAAEAVRASNLYRLVEAMSSYLGASQDEVVPAT